MIKFLQNWTFTRSIYLCAGIFFALIGAFDREWIMMALGLYFMAMAIFKFGCAGGSCTIPQNEQAENSLK